MREKSLRSVSIQVISKVKGRYKVLKTIGCGAEHHKIKYHKRLAKQEIECFFKEFDTNDEDVWFWKE